jgi:hypothetical protein
MKPPYIYSYPTDSFWKIVWAVKLDDKGWNPYEAVVFGKLKCRLWGVVHLHQWLPVKT